MTEYAYPLDKTGIAATNKIVDEEHILTECNYKDYAYIIPEFSPFYFNNIVIYHIQEDDSRKELIEGVDYYPALQYISATRSLGREVWGGISFTNRAISGRVVITYQTLGGNYVCDRGYIIEALTEMNVNPRLAYWEHVVNTPLLYPPIEHEQDFDTIYGQNALIDAIDRIADKIGKNDHDISYIKHLSDLDNPHKVTLSKLGYEVSTVYDVNEKDREDKLISNKLFYQNVEDIKEKLEDNLTSTDEIINNRLVIINDRINEINDRLEFIDERLSNHDNDISNINNKLSILEDKDNELLLELRSHILNKNNPHSVNKAQVGLGNVSNLPIAPDIEVDSNIPVDKYVTLRQIVTFINGGPSYAISGYNLTVREGQEVEFIFNAEKVFTGTVFVWKISHGTTTDEMFGNITTGEFAINNEVGVFKVNIANNISGQGKYTFSVGVYSKINEDTMLARTLDITIEDDSIDNSDYLLSDNFYDPHLRSLSNLDLSELYYHTSEHMEDTRSIDHNDSRTVRVKDRRINDSDYLLSDNFYDPDIRSKENISLTELLFNSINRTNDSREVGNKDKRGK